MKPAGMEILLVEDNPMELELTLHALRKQNLDNCIEVAGDGEGTHSKRSFESPPKLIILDLELPKVGGLEVLRAIKNDTRTHAIPVAILTSSTRTGTWWTAIRWVSTATSGSRLILTSSEKS